MFSLSSIVSTISICDNNSTSYEQFIHNHQERHNRNVLVAQSNTQRNVGFINHRDKSLLHKGGYKKKNVKFIKQQPPNNNYRKQSHNNYQQNLTNNYQQTKKYNNRSNSDIHYIIQYSFNNNNKNYPLNKILNHLSNNFNINFKNSLSYNSFNVKYIKVKGLDKSRHYISIHVGVNYNVLDTREISNLGNRFQVHPLYDNNTQVRFSFVNYKIN